MRAPLAADVARLLKRCPDLEPGPLSDGAPDLQPLVDGAVEGQTDAAKRTDIRHLLEKLAAAMRATGRYPKDPVGDWRDALLTRDRAIEAIEADLKSWEAEYDPNVIPADLHAALTCIANRRAGCAAPRPTPRGCPSGVGRPRRPARPS